MKGREVTREDIEGKDQETDDDGEINPVDESQAEKKIGQVLSAFVRPTPVASPEQWWAKHRVSAVGGSNRGFLPSCRFRTNNKTENFKRDEQQARFGICWANFDAFGLLSRRD